MCSSDLAMVSSPGRAGTGGSLYASLDGQLLVTGQAVLEDREDLADRVGAPRDSRSVALIAAAYHTWEDAFTTHLSGEYAFVLWDRRREVLIGARDGLGIRTLYAARAGESVVISNTLDAMRAVATISQDLDEIGRAHV